MQQQQFSEEDILGMFQQNTSDLFVQNQGLQQPQPELPQQQLPMQSAHIQDFPLDHNMVQQSSAVGSLEMDMFASGMGSTMQSMTPFDAWNGQQMNDLGIMADFNGDNFGTVSSNGMSLSDGLHMNMLANSFGSLAGLNGVSVGAGIDTLSNLPSINTTPDLSQSGALRLGRRHSVSAKPMNAAASAMRHRRKSSVVSLNSVASFGTMDSSVVSPLTPISTTLVDPAVDQLARMFQESDLDANMVAMAAAAANISMDAPVALSVNAESGEVTMQLPLPRKTPEASHLTPTEQQRLERAEMEEELLSLNFDDITVVTMKTLLRKANLSACGKKHELLSRLKEEAERIQRKRIGLTSPLSDSGSFHSINTEVTKRDSINSARLTNPSPTSTLRVSTANEDDWDSLLVCSPNTESNPAKAQFAALESHQQAFVEQILNMNGMQSNDFGEQFRM
jgi:hypothetical protein